MTTITSTELSSSVEAETKDIGRELFRKLKQQRPMVFQRRWWEDRILSRSMGNEAVKVQMFRFVDVLPMLKTHDAVIHHLQEYFAEIANDLPWAVRKVMSLSPSGTLRGNMLAKTALSNSRRMAKRFIAGSNVVEVLKSVKKIRDDGYAFSLDLLGEAIISEKEADAYQKAYLDLIAGLTEEVNHWKENPQIDRDHSGPIPRVNVSLKLSALYSQFTPRDPKGTAEGVKKRLRPLLRKAHECGAYLHVDMEHYSYKNITLEIFKQVMMEEEFRNFADVGIVIQVYLPDAEEDLQRLLAWVKERGTPVWVRLVKGAYWDFETVVAQANNWPIPVFQQKWQSDECFEKSSVFLLENYEWLRPAFASHNMRSLAHALAVADKLEVPKDAYEIQMLFGMAGDQARLFTEMGYRVRVYTPFGEPIPGMAYLVRRLLENTSNDSFLKQSITDHLPVEKLLMNPTEIGRQSSPLIEQKSSIFTNEPHTDFSRAEYRDAMQQALDEVSSQLGKDYPIVIAGREYHTEKKIDSQNPSHQTQVVGRASSATKEMTEEAITEARNAFPGWAKTSVETRADYLEMIGEEMRKRKYELCAWEIFECGKPWDEADGDVAEAIDFCMYYAEEMRKLGIPRNTNVPGEDNSYWYRPRGVTVVISPWNFPLAILTGMTAAALVAGNTVIMKPAGQSPIIAAKLMEIARKIGLPDGVLNYLPGSGREIGPILVNSPQVDLIAFTGSREVGLSINHDASLTSEGQNHVCRVIAEMGGKNALIVDSDADLDEAVAGVVQSAFGYAGQKCSACSRVVVLESAYDTFLQRLVEATRSIEVGPAELPGTKMGPVIDAGARKSIREYIELGHQAGKLVLAYDLGDLEDEGTFVGPHIFADVDPNSQIAQEEIFGPVLAVIKAKDLDEAIQIVNGTDYALTAGIFSRSPNNLKRATSELEAGNIYLNRGITGALVNRQPFGGFKMSGIGSKAGGPDYLQQFLIPVNVTENTMRRGFAPVEDV